MKGRGWPISASGPGLSVHYCTPRRTVTPPTLPPSSTQISQLLSANIISRLKYYRSPFHIRPPCHPHHDQSLACQVPRLHYHRQPLSFQIQSPIFGPTRIKHHSPNPPMSNVNGCASAPGDCKRPLTRRAKYLPDWRPFSRRFSAAITFCTAIAAAWQWMRLVIQVTFNRKDEKNA